ncbi:hypothetical protein OPHB3_3101 [Oceanobacillus picturae]|uniref:HNH endonuclease n=1 Tax=Oceanobacillus picturae TaxID=171693 RepID=A0A0U9HH64_9BACI|nr:hypothetical protein [Oceanobacillus picturae]GAQ19142.1 hypothetical protein OPHB3_3101 [Oceanobacillus picturae]
MREKGICALCGFEAKLTFEHIPPKCSGNNKRTKGINFDSYIKGNLVNDNKALDDLKGLKYKSMQKGMGKYSLCESCNNNTGTWYGNEYCYFSNTVASLLKKEGYEVNSMISFTMRMKPLNVMKQIISMFCSINPATFIDQALRDFVLEKQNLNFNSNKYKVSAFIYPEGMDKHLGRQGLLYNNGAIVNVSEISTYPIGFCLYKEPFYKEFMFGGEITDFKNAKYNEEHTVNLRLPVLSRKSIVANKFRQ